MNCTQALLSLLLLSPCSDGPSSDTAVRRDKPVAAVPVAPLAPVDPTTHAPADTLDSELDGEGAKDPAALGGTAETRVPKEEFH